MSSQRDIVLVGPMGAGKTSVGQQLAAWLGTRFDDLDHLVESREGKAVSELFAIGPHRLTPGSKMPLQRIPDAADRAELVRFLLRMAGRHKED